MRLKTILAALALLLLLPAPAFADVTARYTANGQQIDVEVDDGGDSRFDVGGIFSIIRRDGVDYVAMAMPGAEPRVTQLEGFLEMMAVALRGPGAPTPPVSSAEFSLEQGGEETVAGRLGTIWKFGPADKPLDFVMSADPELAPVGAVFVRMIDLARPMLESMFGDTNNMLAGLTELMTKGTPIRVGPVVMLVSIDTADIPAERFELPAEPVTPMEFMESMQPPQPGSDGAMQPLP